MKKICILLCFLLIAVSACKKDGNKPSDLLLGKWGYQKKVYSYIRKDGSVMNNGTAEINSRNYILFYKDKTGQSVAYGSDEWKPIITNFTYTSAKSQISISYTEENEESGDYKVSTADNDHMVLTRDVMSEPLKITIRTDIYLLKLQSF